MKGDYFMKTEKFVPYEKLSKKAKKALDQKKRADWGLVRPATQVEKSVKAYSRHAKHKHKERENYFYA